MSNFKKGDRVKRFKHKDARLPHNGMQIGDVDTVVRVYDWGTALELESFGRGHSIRCFERVTPAYPNPPHKHAELIKAWADGAEIEFFYRVDKKWRSVDEPFWECDVEYRIKPSNPNAEKIAEIETTISQLQQQVKELKNAD